MRGVSAAIVASWVAIGGVARAGDAGYPAGSLSTITVEGEARRDATPDMAVITLGVTTNRTSALDAATQTAKTAKAMIDEIKASGIADRDVETAEATLTPTYDVPRNGDTPKVKGFRATNVVTVRVRKLEQAGDLAGRLLDKGANELQGVSFVVADPQPILDALRAEATLNARHRAEIYAQAAGVTLGRILEIEPEASPSSPVYGRQMKLGAPAVSDASVPLQAGSQAFEARVNVTWVLGQSQP